MESPVPVHTRANEIVAQVLSDHGLSQTWLADATGCSSSFVSRVLDAQYSVPPEMIAALWARTRDQRLARITLGEHHLVAMPASPVLGAWDDHRDAAMHAAADAVMHLVACADPEQPGARRRAGLALDAAIQRLALARRALPA